MMHFGQAVLSAVSVGIGCGAGCGSAASAFLTTYVVSEGLKWSSSLRQVLSFYIGKLLAVLLICAAGSLIGQSFISYEGMVMGFPLKTVLFGVMLIAALRLLYGWFRELKGCKACGHCASSIRLVPSFAVGLAYGLSPCAPLLMVLGYAAILPLPAAIALGFLFSLASSLVPAILTLILSGALSVRLVPQLGKMLPWFRLIVYLFYLASALTGLLA